MIPIALAGATLSAALVVLAIPYLAVREISLAEQVSSANPSAALSDLATAARLNPLDSDPGRLGGTIALRNGQLLSARARFEQAIQREPGDWFSWLGAGLADSSLGRREAAQRDFRIAYAINNQQPATKAALQRVDTSRPLSSSEAFRLLILVN